MIVFAMTGVLGGFAAFSLDKFKPLEAGRMVFAAGYVVASGVLSLAAVLSGILLTRGVWG